MAWVLLAGVVALALLVAVLGALVLGLRARLASLEARLASSDTNDRPQAAENLPHVSLDDNRREFVITQVGADDEPEAAVARVDATLFGDQLAQESVVQVAAMVHGLRRALSAETRNRIRFHVRQETKRARKQRRVEMRIAHREWTARQRVAAAEDSAA